MDHLRTGHSAVAIAERLRSFTNLGDPNRDSESGQHLLSGTDPDGLLLSFEGLITTCQMAESVGAINDPRRDR